MHIYLPVSLPPVLATLFMLVVKPLTLLVTQRPKVEGTFFPSQDDSAGGDGLQLNDDGVSAVLGDALSLG